MPPSAALEKERIVKEAQKHILDACGFMPMDEKREMEKNLKGLVVSLAAVALNAGLTFSLVGGRWQSQVSALLC